NVIFDLGIPRIGLHLGKPPCKFTLLPMRELLNLGLDLDYTVHMARVHWRRILVTSLINARKNQSPLKRADHLDSVLMECAGRAQRRRRFGSESRLQAA